MCGGEDVERIMLGRSQGSVRVLKVLKVLLRSFDVALLAWGKQRSIWRVEEDLS